MEIVRREEIMRILDDYDEKDITIGTIGSHSALQILHGARQEGFRTLVICLKGVEELYERFGVADDILTVNNYREMISDEFQEMLRSRNVILIPHGSFVEYLSAEGIASMRTPIFGNRKVLEWESDRGKQREWLAAAGIKMPMSFERSDEIDRLVIVKLHGAKGGSSYFIASSPEELKQKLRDIDNAYEIQEYIIGTRFYPHYFHSFVRNRTELLGIDIRYESNIDGLARITPVVTEKIEPSFVVTGNIPVVARESLLLKILHVGDGVVSASRSLFSGGIVGPFCVELVCTDTLELFAFEISARIVAGTNLYINGSPYSQILFNESMSTGRRIAIEIKEAIRMDMLHQIVY